MLLLETHYPLSGPPVPDPDPRPEMLCFRGQALALVRHFFELSCQLGRLPSLLGREFFRARVSHHATPSFEEQVLFVRDVELCFAKLSDEHMEIITLVGLYDFSHDEVAEMLHTCVTAVHRWFSEALDSLSELFLRAGLLSESRPDRRQKQLMKGPPPRDLPACARKPPDTDEPYPHGAAHSPGDRAAMPDCNLLPA
ncbi:MAG TPA: sigma factor-like helix-turn-helix DNA-binding protein [Candidatus Binatia bacterium]|nr:sigma factor-like helix-turn-helix DNA-binding protein [Candidatus Binatia bacterium]